MTPFLSIIIPAYNEEDRITQTLQKIIEFKNNLDFPTEIIVVDDGSKDRTIEVASKFGDVKVIAQVVNQGKGAAVRRGMIESSGEIRIFTDADLSTPIYEIYKVLESIRKGYDVCIGSRAIDKSLIKLHQPFYREWMGKIFNQIVQLLVIPGIHDTQCGFKGFTRKSALAIFPYSKIDGFGFDVEILYLAKLNNFKVSETPVEWYNDDRTKVSPIKDSYRMFRDILRVRDLHKNGKP